MFFCTGHLLWVNPPFSTKHDKAIFSFHLQNSNSLALKLTPMAFRVNSSSKSIEKSGHKHF